MLAFNRHAAKITWTVGLVALGLFAVYSVRRTLFVFLLAVFFSYMVYPAVRRIALFAPKRLSHMAATAIVFVALVLAFVGVIAAIGPPLAEQASKLAEQLPALTRDPKALDNIPLPEWLSPFRDRVAQFVREQSDAKTSYALPIARQIGQIALEVASNLIYVVLIPILAFLFIKDGTAMRDGFLRWVQGVGHGSMWRHIVDDLDVLLGRYIRALLILSGATVVVYSIFFSVAGVPYGLLLAALAGVLEFIPVVGPLAAALACLVVAGLSGYDHLLLLVVFIGCYRLVQDYVVNPYLMSGGVEVPPLLVLFGLLAGEELGGVVGIFLSVPALAAAKIVVARIAQEVRSGPEPELLVTSTAAEIERGP